MIRAFIARHRAKLPAFVVIRIAFIAGGFFALTAQGLLAWWFVTGGTLLGVGAQ